jgi:expansin (peptidoglycan-binding protein)
MRRHLYISLLVVIGCQGTADRQRDGAASRLDGPRGEHVLDGGDTLFPEASPVDGSLDLVSPFPLQSGKITYYDADGSGNCSFPPSPSDLMVAAMNTIDYEGSQACGECVKVNGPKGTVVVRIVDRCPECEKGHVDLSQQAFAEIADLHLGVVPVTWQVVPCPVSGPVVYHFMEGSSQWWTAIQLRNIRYPVASLEVKSNGAFQPVSREMYNYFVDRSGLGPGPYTLRVTDVLGHALTDPAIPHRSGEEVPGAAQFPP